MIRGAIAALSLGSAVLLIGWILPRPETDLRPWAFALGPAPMIAAALAALWPRKRLDRAAALDARLSFGDRIATAWAYRRSERAIARLQRNDTISRLGQREAHTDLRWKAARAELIILGVCGAVFAVLLVAPSPQQGVLDRQTAEQAAVTQASERLDVLREEAIANPALTADQARQLNELLQQAQAELNRSHTQQEATSALARAQDRVAQQLADPNADLRNQALAAMSDTLAAEPRTQALADALQNDDARAASEAIKELAAQADQLSDVERQALSRALQRAANVGRSDPRTASALREAAQALGSPSSASSSQEALSAADAALSEAIQASRGQASVSSALQRLHNLQAQLAADSPLRADAVPPSGERDSGTTGLPVGTAVALDAAGGQQQLREPVSDETRGAGFGTAGLSGGSAADQQAAQPAENVFVPGRESNGPSSQELVDQPFTVRGQPRPYRDVLSQYAASSRDYIDRPDVSPAVRDLVKQYFQSLEEGQ
jgi:hypothetical protein